MHQAGFVLRKGNECAEIGDGLYFAVQNCADGQLHIFLCFLQNKSGIGCFGDEKVCAVFHKIQHLGSDALDALYGADLGNVLR